MPEFIASPSIDSDGCVTHDAAAEIGYNVEDFPGLKPKPVDIEPASTSEVDELAAAVAEVARAEAELEAARAGTK